MTAARSDLMALAREAVAQYRGMGDKVIYSGEHAANILEHWLDRLAASRPDRSDASPGPDVRRRVLDILNAVAPAVENLVGHQEQCDMDGVMVKVSRQALDEVLNAVNEVALVSALTRPLGALFWAASTPAPGPSVRATRLPRCGQTCSECTGTRRGYPSPTSPGCTR